MSATVSKVRVHKIAIYIHNFYYFRYILYQCIMLLSSILGPGTIFLMIVGAISISFNIDTFLALIIVALPVSLFCLLCFISNSGKQVCHQK